MTIQRWDVPEEEWFLEKTEVGRFVQWIDHLTALAEKEEKIQAAMEAGKMLKEQRDKAEEEIVALTDENKRQSEEIRLLRRALGNCNPDHNLLMPEEALQDEKGEKK